MSLFSTCGDTSLTSLNNKLFVRKDVLQSVDRRIKQIHDAVPSQSLMLVILGCSDLSLVKRQVILNSRSWL